MPLITAKDLTTMIDEALRNVLDRTPISNISSDSRARLLLELPLSELANLWGDLEALEKESFLSTASGIYLDAIGELFGVQRIPSQTARTIGPSFKFYRSSVGTSVTIPSRTRVYPPDNPELSFYTTTAATMGISDTEVFVALEAADSGSIYSAGAYTLIAHDDTTNSAIRCTNIYPITNGSDEEEDDNFRYRISRAIFSAAACNADALRMGLLNIPGVRDVILKPFARGTGSVDVLIYSYFPTVSDDLLERVQEELDERLAAYGIKATAIAPTTISVGVRVRLGFKNTTSTEMKAIIRQNVKNAIAFYLDNLSIGAPAILDQITKAILLTSNEILQSDIYLIEVSDETRIPENIIVDEDERIVSNQILIS